ncbi:MAG: hypothetical protein AAF090_01195 [Bacteroidota bacterium]
MTIQFIPRIALLLFFAGILHAQKPETVLNSPEGWNSEQISFPLSFAPDIGFTGFEDIRFAPGWPDKESEAFWAYHFVWYIDQNDPMTEASLTKIMEAYYDGLMLSVSKSEEHPEGNLPEKTMSLFIKTENGFTGKVRVFDAFFSKKTILLNFKVKEFFCDKTQKQVVAFDISQQPFGHSVWKEFDAVQLMQNVNKSTRHIFFGWGTLSQSFPNSLCYLLQKSYFWAKFLC